MSKSQVLALRFQCANGKKYNVRIKNADPAVNADTVKKLADTMVSTKLLQVHIIDFSSEQ